MNVTLAGHLWHLGNGLGRDTVWARLRFVAITTATLMLTGALVVPTLGLLLIDQREHRAAARLPVPASTARPAALHMWFRLPTVTDAAGAAHTVSAIWLAPVIDDAPLPPGVARWPGPGEAVVSPQLRRDLVGGEHPPDLLGRDIGVIAASGLETATERLAYVRPALGAQEAESPVEIAGFGRTGMSSFGGLPSANARPTWVSGLTWGGLLVTPALVALALAAGIGAETRSGRARQLQAMGADRRHIATVDAAEAATGILAGSGLAGAALAVLGLVGFSAPTLDFRIPAEQLRAWWLPCLAALAGAHLVAYLVVLTTRVAQRSWLRHRPLGRRQRLPAGRALICVGATLAAVWLPALSTSGAVRTLGYYLAAIVVIGTIPAFIGVLLSAIGQRAAAWGMRRGSPGTVLAGRHLALSPARTARLVGGVAAAILLVGQVQLVASTLGAQYRLAQANQRAFGDLVLTAGTTNRSVMETVIDQLPSGRAAPVWTAIKRPASAVSSVSDQVGYVFGSCPALEALGLRCESATLSPVVGQDNKTFAALASEAGFDGGKIRVVLGRRPDYRRIDELNASLHVISTIGTDLPADAIRRTANRAIIGGVDLQSTGDSWLSGGVLAVLTQRWIVFWALLGIVPLLIVTALVLAADVLMSARETAAIAALSDRRGWLRVFSAWRVWLPLALAGAYAVLIYLIMPTNLTSRGADISYFTPSFTFAGAFVVASFLTGLVLAAWSAERISVAARAWRPGR
ncbi:MAG: hypothetical protein ACRCYQ_04470 [Nocardioides sp.]